MKITHVICQILQVHSVNSASPQAQELALIRVRADNGLEGIGQASVFPTLIKGLLDGSGLRDLLLGENPLENERLCGRLRDHTRSWGDCALATTTIGAIDVALWDLKGKHFQEPLHRLLGGLRHEQLPVCASVAFGADPGETQAIARRWVKAGYNAVKFGWDASRPGEELNREMMRGARSGLGDQGILMVDAAGAWDVRTALRRAEAVADLNLTWLEDPVRGNDLENYAWLRNRSPIPLAGGKQQAGRGSLKPWLDRHALDVYQIDVARTGFTDAAYLRTRVEDLGASLGNCPAWNSIAVAATLHWLATCSAPALLQEITEDSLLRNDLTEERFQAEDGLITIPNGPGLGLMLNEQFVKQHLVAESGA